MKKIDQVFSNRTLQGLMEKGQIQKQAFECLKCFIKQHSDPTVPANAVVSSFVDTQTIILWCREISWASVLNQSVVPLLFELKQQYPDQFAGSIKKIVVRVDYDMMPIDG